MRQCTLEVAPRSVEWTAAVLLPAVLGIVGCADLQPETTIESISMGGGSLEVGYQDILGAAAFAAHTVRFYSRDDSGERLLAQTTLDNDGAVPSEQNVAVSARADGTLQVTLTGAERPDER